MSAANEPCGAMQFTPHGQRVCDRPRGHALDCHFVDHDCPECGRRHGVCKHCGTTRGDTHERSCLHAPTGHGTSGQLADVIGCLTDTPAWWYHYYGITVGAAAFLATGAVGACGPERAKSAREGWETLIARGLLPASWADDRERVFVDDEDELPCTIVGGEDDGATLTHFDRPRPYPPTLAAVAAIAADPRGIIQAEALAREAVRESWAERKSYRCVWRTADAKEIDNVQDYTRVGESGRYWDIVESIDSLGYAVSHVGEYGVVLLCPEVTARD